MRIGWPAFVVPMLFVFSPALLLASGWLENLYAAIAATGGVFLVTIAVVGFFQQVLALHIRALFSLAGIALLLPLSTFPGAVIINMAGFLCELLLMGMLKCRTSRGIIGSY